MVPNPSPSLPEMGNGQSSPADAEGSSAIDDAIAVYEAAARRMRPSWDPAPPAQQPISSAPPSRPSTSSVETYVVAAPSIPPVPEAVPVVDDRAASYASPRLVAAPLGAMAAAETATMALPAGHTVPALFERDTRRGAGVRRLMAIGVAAVGAVACALLFFGPETPAPEPQKPRLHAASGASASPPAGNAASLPPSALAPAAPVNVAAALLAASRDTDVAPQAEPKRPRKGARATAAKASKAQKATGIAGKPKPKVTAKNASKSVVPTRPGKTQKLVRTNPY
jgi:hypothetical protein